MMCVFSWGFICEPAASAFAGDAWLLQGQAVKVMETSRDTSSNHLTHGQVKDADLPLHRLTPTLHNEDRSVCFFLMIFFVIDAMVTWLARLIYCVLMSCQLLLVMVISLFLIL